MTPEVAMYRCIFVACVAVIVIIFQFEIGVRLDQRRIRRRMRVERDRLNGMTSTGTTYDESTSLTLNDLNTAYTALSGRRMARSYAASQQQALAAYMMAQEPVVPADETFTQYLRRKYENKRDSVDSAAGSSSSVLFRSGPSISGNISNDMASIVRAYGMDTQGENGQDPFSARLGQATVGTSSA